MRDAKEIEHLQTELLNAAANHEMVDNFQYGLMCGKLYALSWVQGEMTTGAISVHEDFEDYLRESAIDRDELRRKIYGDRDPDTSQPE